MKIIKVKTENLINIVSSLANEIWNEHYSGIVPKPQIDYMLERFQSASAISKQISSQNYLYYLLQADGGYQGYFAILPKTGELFLSKIYIKVQSRKKGYGKESVTFIKETAKKLNLKQITLTVNKNNLSSIEAYKKIGFIIADSIKSDIGSGFYMDDYLMSLGV
ncbi:GNAT family N-acetyltransferase [Endomicrobium proavitum]|uniref:GNAT family N-acetyltransferase n=1 Tax=Endomicrobium proavitum TaxID=1408281 RepID=UPI00130D91E8|nr:GNAT family N-acetyltransferase [Endomicrobium proavitum]